MATRTSLFLVALLTASPIGQETRNQFVVWNVGQGLWTTAITDGLCLHFDMGGERAPWEKIIRLCRAQANQVHLSHWDSDHINFLPQARYFLPRLCRVNEPPFPRSDGKRRLVQRAARCPLDARAWTSWQPREARSSNAQSVVALWSSVLIPGDSSSSQESEWSRQMRAVRTTKILVLGHHGSRTATSELLIGRLPGLRLAIASARKRRYGHPHQIVIDRLKDFAVPVLSTEDWGSIHIWL